MDTIADTASPSITTERRFFTWMTVAPLLVVFAGFASSYYLWPITHATHYPAGQPISASLPLLVHVHAALFSAWVGLLAVQARLVRRGQTKVHRRLGRLAPALLILMVGIGVLTAARGARDGWNPGGAYRDALSFMFVGIADIGVFTTLTAAGLALRRRPDVHKRLMLLGTLGGLLWPAITRMPLVAGRLPVMLAVLAGLVLAPAIHDFIARSSARWLSLGVGLAVLATFPLRLAVGNSELWRAVAAWLVS